MPINSLDRDLATLIDVGAPEITLGELYAIDLTDKRRPRLVVATILAASTLVLVTAVGLLWWGKGPTSDPSVDSSMLEGTTATTAPTETTVPSATPAGDPAPATFGSVWELAYPPDWHRAGSELMPNLGFRSVTLATMPLTAGGELCAHMPENSLRAMGAGDVLLTVFFRATLDSSSQEFPDNINDSTFPISQTDAQECAERPTLEVHWGDFAIDGESVYVLLVFGEDVDPALERTAWEVLGSFGKEADLSGNASGRVCIVTRPGIHDFIPPEPYHLAPSNTAMAWFGTPALWTPLPVDGPYEQRKSVWWSTAFPGGSQEESPPISVTWRRLDVDAPQITNEVGTNAHTEEDGWFMISGIDPQTPGCWEVTATYKGATLSYVYARS